MKKLLLPLALVILAYGFYATPQFGQIAAGVAIFLYGMLFLENGFKAFTGGVLERALQKATSNTFKSILFGTVTTTLMQSSSLVSIITISFLSAGLITLVAGIGIILGANIGTTTGAWLVAAVGLKVKISAYAMPMLVFSIVLSFQKSKYLKGIGAVLGGLGFLFLGIHFMKEGFEAFKDNFDLAAYAVSGYPGLFLFAGIGVLATVIMQSSHATLVLILTALAAQQITYENALALSIGANVGTTITAIIGSISANIDGKRLAGAHLIFNVLTGVVAILFIKQFVWAVDFVSSQVGIGNDDYTMKLAVFHTLFNVVGVLLILPFIRPMASFLCRVLPSKGSDIVEPIYLSEATLEFPETVESAVRKELWHLYDSAFILIAHGLNLHTDQIYDTPEDDLEALISKDREVIDFDIEEAYEHKVKLLYGEILAFISLALQQDNSGDSEALYKLRTAASSIANCVKAVKHLRNNLTHYMLSDNRYIRNEYNKIRLNLVNLLRLMQSYRQSDATSYGILELDEIQAEIEVEKKRVNDVITHLLAMRLVTPKMATSLLNDFRYSAVVIESLIDCGQTLLNSREAYLHGSQDDILLDEEEIEAIAGEPDEKSDGESAVEKVAINSASTEEIK